MEDMSKVYKFFGMNSIEDIDDDMKVSFLLFVNGFEHYKEMVKEGKIPDDKIKDFVGTAIKNKEYLTMFLAGYQLAVDAGEGENFERLINEVKETSPFKALNKNNE